MSEAPTREEQTEFSIRAFRGVEVGLGQADPTAAIAAKLEAKHPGHLVLVQAGKFLHGFDLLTTAPHQYYRSPVAETKATGIGVPVRSGEKPRCMCSAAFLSSGVALNGRAGRESRKARRCSAGTPIPFSSAHPIGVGEAVHNLNRSATMSNTPTVFNFNSNEVRTLVINDEPWFVASDVCAALGYKNVSQTIGDHLDADERASAMIPTPIVPIGVPTNIISESGLYALVLRSRKPEARKFAKWVTSEVLPAIRKTGSYSNSAEYDPSVSHGEAIRFAMNYVTELDRHAKEPTKHPYPKWNDAEANRMADGIVSAWMLRNNRWLLSFGSDGTPSLRMIQKDACVMSVERLLEAINEPNGMSVKPELLFKFVQATVSRLEKSYDYIKSKADGKPVKLHW